MMRLAFASLTLALAALFAAPDPAAAQFYLRHGDRQMLYFWESPTTYGWSATPPANFGAPPPRIVKRMSLYEACARQVGRIVLMEDSAQIRSFTMTEHCVRNGGRVS